MSKTSRRLYDEDGAVLVLTALLLPVLLVLTAGGVAGFGLMGSHRELQRAADQAAVAAAAAVPPADPGLLAANSPFPLPGTEAVYELADEAGADAPRMGQVAPDPRAVACAYAVKGLEPASARLTAAFEDQTGFLPPVDEGGNEMSTLCEDDRVYPALAPDTGSTSPAECANRLVQQVAGNREAIQDLIAPIASISLENLLPAAFSPRVRVGVFSRQNPPLLSLVRGGDGQSLTGRTIGAAPAALRRIKNAVVVPILPAQQLEIELGLTDPITVITDPVNLNHALHQQQEPLIDAIHNVDSSLDGVMSTLGVPCSHLLHNLERDLRDIYDPPTGPAPSAADIVEAAVTAQQQAANRLGAAEPDPSDPGSLAGEAFFLIGVSSGPLGALQVPILDAALVVMNEGSEGDYEASVVSAANARGAFRATLVN